MPAPAVIGHRGLGKGIVAGLRENTLESFLAAVEHGLGWVEIDARRTADDVLVVHHHPTVDDGSFVIDSTAAELAAAGVLRLADLLDALPPHVGIDLDIKSSLEDALEPASATVRLIAPVVGAELRRRPVLVTSFDPAVLLGLRELVPAAPLGLLAWLYFPLRKAIPAAAHLGMQVVAAHWQSFGPNSVDPAPVHRSAAYTVDIAHRVGLEVLAWCPPPKEAVALIEAGVDAVCVNNAPALGLPGAGDHGLGERG